LSATVTLAGTVNEALLLPKVTTIALVAALFNETVQVLDALLLNDEGEHDTEESCAGALPVSVKVWVPPFREAESRAVWFELMLATVAVKEALVNPAPTPTLAGTVMLPLLLDNVTVAPPPGAAAVSVTVQLDVPGAFTVAGEQLKLAG
jgi:hypothetical protein